MLVTYILGDCPSCEKEKSFGNISVYDNRVLRGCKFCNYRTYVILPEIRKNILYLDQCFFSSAFRGSEHRFLDAIEHIKRISNLQLLVAPFSSVHEDETYQWRGYDGKNREDLMGFIKSSSRGHRFEPAYDVERVQVIRAFRGFLDGASPDFLIDEKDALGDDVHKWDDYFRIDIAGYFNDSELIRGLKDQAARDLIDAFVGWRVSKSSFEQDVDIELSGIAEIYKKSYQDYIKRFIDIGFLALIDAPIMYMIFDSLLNSFEGDILLEDKFEKIYLFFLSEHFAQIPYNWIMARAYAVLKDMVKRGAYTNYDNALKRLNGFYHDLKHIATYAPYCDAFFMDKPMAAIINDPRIAIESRYGVKVFSLNTIDEFIGWLGDIEKNMSKEHLIGVSAAYPRLFF